MKRCLMLIAVFVVALPLVAQGPLSTEAQQAWARTSGNMIAAAERMPEENYSFKPAPANSAMGACSSVNGEAKQAGADAAGSKAAMVTALKAAMAECDKANQSLTDATATQMIEGRRGARSRLGTIYGNTIHMEHEYAQMAVHFRLKGLVPPSSDRR
jgi:hypothetical protein